MYNHDDLPEILTHVDPGRLEYEEWLQVGMALHDSGHDVAVWDEWSRRDVARYHEGECAAKWKGFGKGGMNTVKSGTIIALAKAQGWQQESAGHELDWDSEIGGKDDKVIIDHNWLQLESVPKPLRFDPVTELVTYLETLYDSTEYVGYCCEVWQKDDRWLPTKGAYDRTAGELIQALTRCGGDIGSVLGDVNEAAGAWIRFNPLDGKGVRDENVTSYRYALVECDNMSIERQYAIIKQLELPVAVLVHSGKKSLHAIVRVDAYNYEEYRRRVDYIYDVCRKNGLELDKQNRNPSRLSRMPGVMRDGQMQYIVARGIGQESYDAWHEFIESANDNLPDEIGLAGALENLPELSPALIRGVLRMGHKMLISGPSKAGKSFALIELCIAIAEGLPWMGFPCEQGKVLYVNLELDAASCLHRFADVYKAYGVNPVDRHAVNIDVWNLRGHSAPMDKLAPKLIRRAAKKAYTAIVIDPIYKIITGDENSADQMAAFCNQFDKVATELGCAVIYCHHHSKGAQGHKNAQDRSSGSGVFARDPDAVLDMIQLPASDAMHSQERNNRTAALCLEWLRRWCRNWSELASQDDQCSAVKMMEICRNNLPERAMALLASQIDTATKTVQSRTAWRISGILREFPEFEPRNVWFEYPIHKVDTVGALEDARPEGVKPAWGSKEASKAGIDAIQANREKRRREFDAAIQICGGGEPPTVDMLYEYFGGDRSKKTLYAQLKRNGYRIDPDTKVIIKTEHNNNESQSANQ